MIFLDTVQTSAKTDNAIIANNLVNQTHKPIRFTVVSSTNPEYLTKRFSLSSDNTIQKKSYAFLSEGRVEIKTCANLSEFMTIRQSLASHQALIYGVPRSTKKKIVTQAQLAYYPESIARTNKFFSFPEGLGLMMFDYDPAPDMPVLTPDDLYERLLGIAPVFADTQVLWCPSASSGIKREDDLDQPLISGQRFYIVVKNAHLIPKAGQALKTLTWVNGYGRIQLSSNGRMLNRGIFDESVWQPERLDFAAAPILDQGLVRDVPAARYFGQKTPAFDLQRLIDLVDKPVQEQADRAVEAARQQVKPMSDRKIKDWVEDRLQHGQETNLSRQMVHQAINDNVLCHDFPLISADGQSVTVLDLLKDPKTWHGQRFHDPLEPEYQNDARIAYANLNNDQPYLYSHAHGGQYYRLQGLRKSIYYRTGYRADAVDDYIKGMQHLNTFFELGDLGKLVRVRNNQPVMLEVDLLISFLDRHFEYHELRMIQGNWVDQIKDTPVSIAKSILSQSENENLFPKLEAVITAPTLRCDGTVLEQAGYDSKSKLYLSLTTSYEKIPETPSLETVKQALEVFWEPVALFPFVNAVDCGVILAAMLTALVRCSLPTAPGFAIDAPVAGSGKTLLAQVIANLASGKNAAVLPPISSNDDEVRKRLLSALLIGNPVMLCDNLNEPLGSASLDAALTSESFQDRILGLTKMVSVMNRGMFIFTGNNFQLIGDTCRRVLISRLDPKMERPDNRQFSFNPTEYVRFNRDKLVVAGLTLIRGSLASGQHCSVGSTASFEDWDRLVRQTVCWIATFDERFADPNDVIQHSFNSDPTTLTLRLLLESWATAVGKRSITTNDLISLAHTETVDSNGEVIKEHPALLAALEAITGERQKNQSHALGKWLSKHKERRLSGRWLVEAGKSHGAKLWKLRFETDGE